MRRIFNLKKREVYVSHTSTEAERVTLSRLREQGSCRFGSMWELVEDKVCKEASQCL